MKISPSRLIGTATLGLASIISSSNAEDKKKIEVPNTPQTVQVKEETYFSLLNTLDKDLEKNWDSIAHALYKYILDEPFINDNPPGSRIKKYEGKIVRIKVNKSLTNTFEKILSKILSKPPEGTAPESDKKRYAEALYFARDFFQGLPYTDNQECVIAWQGPILDKITKAKPSDMPKLLDIFQDTFETLWGRLNPGYDKHREIYNAGAKYFKPILEAGCKNLLDKETSNNLIGSQIIKGVKDAYSDWGPVDFSKDEDIKRLFLQVLDKMQKEELKSNDAFARYINNTVDFVHLSWKDPDVVRETARSLTAQVNYAHKAKNNGLDKEWVEIQEAALLNTTNEFVGWMWSVFGTHFDNETISKNIDPLYKIISEKIVKDNTNLKVLHEGRKLVKYLHRFRLNEKPPDEASRKFVEETIIDLLFKNILESSAKLPPLERKDFLNVLQKEDLSWFLGYINKEDLTAATKTLQIFSNHYFDLKDDRNLRHFSSFIKSKIDMHNSNRWHPVVICELLNLNRDYLKAVVNEAVKNIESNKEDKELLELEHLTAYLESLKHLQDLLKDSETSFYPKEKALTVEAFMKDSSRNCSGLFFKRLQDEKVIVERANDGEHRVYDKGFELTIKSLRAISSIHPDKLQDYINTLNKRLDTEKDPRTLGMLHKVSSNVYLKYDLVLTNFKKAIVQASSPLISQKIGEAITDRFMDELCEGKSRAYVFRGHRSYSDGLRYTEIKKLNIDKKIKSFSDRLQKVIEKGIIEPNEKTPAQDFLLNCILYSRGANIETLLKENLGDDLLKKFNPSKELNIEIVKAVHRVLSNSNSILSIFGNELNKEAKHVSLNYHDEESAEWEPALKQLLIVNSEMKKASFRITKLLENNLRRGSNIDTIPHIASGLVLLSSQCKTLDEYNNNIDDLSKKFFKGTNEKLSMFELYELNLQSRFVWKYLEDYRETKRNKAEKAEVEEHCKNLLKRIENIEKIEDIDLRSKVQKDFNPELSKLNTKLFTETVADPLNSGRLHFIREFIALAPSEQRMEYVDIVLNRFGLGRYVSELELKNILAGK